MIPLETRVPPPSAQTFIGQLSAQLLDDLDGLLFEQRSAIADAAAFLQAAAARGGARGALWWLLIAAGLRAHRQLVDAADENAGTADDEIEAHLGDLLPEAAAQIPALRAHARALRQYVAVAEAASVPPEETLARAIVRLYGGLAEGNEARSHRGLIELRSLAVYLDTTASALGAPLSSEIVRVIRPDRFHDYFLRFADSAQRPAADGSERAVASLSQTGRISAAMTRDEHPLEFAERELRAQLGAERLIADHSLLRIKALLAFIEALRRDPPGNRSLHNPLDDAAAHSALVVAAATAPLRLGDQFQWQSLAQLAAFNRTLLQRAAGATRAD